MDEDFEMPPVGGVNDDDDMDFDDASSFLKVGEEKEIQQGLKKKLVKEGEGYETPESGDEVEVHYTGTLLDGTKFDSASTGARLSNSLSDKVRLSKDGIFVSKQMRGYVWLDKAVKIKSESNGASWLAWKKEGEAISEETANFDGVSSSPPPEVTGSQTRHLLGCGNNLRVTVLRNPEPSRVDDDGGRVL